MELSVIHSQCEDFSQNIELTEENDSIRDIKLGTQLRLDDQSDVKKSSDNKSNEFKNSPMGQSHHNFFALP